MPASLTSRTNAETKVQTARRLRVGVPDLESYSRASGIGRVLWSLNDNWGEEVQLSTERFRRSSLPLLRNAPYGVTLSSQPDLIMLPQLTRAEALRTLNRVPSIVVVHDVGIVDFPGDIAALDLYSRWRIRQSFRALTFATRIVAVSDFTAERLSKHLPQVAERIVTIPNGVGEDFLTFQESVATAEYELCKTHGFSIRRPLLLCVGSEHPRKNLKAVIDALGIIKRDYPDAQLIKIGKAGDDRWRKDSLRWVDDAGLRPGRDVVLIDEADDRDLARAYRAADLYVSASRYEGFGLPLLEAMAIGTRFVVSNCGALPEVAGDLGLAVNPDGQVLAQAISQTIRRPAQPSHSQQLRDRARRFSWKISAQKYLAMMREVIGKA